MVVRRIPPRSTSGGSGGDTTGDDGTRGAQPASGPDLVYVGHEGKMPEVEAPEGFHVGGIGVKCYWPCQVD